MRRSRRFAVLLVLLAGAAAGCAGSPGEIRLPGYLRTGATGPVSLALAHGTATKIDWQASAGKIVGSGSDVTLQAPSGAGEITVTARTTIAGHAFVASGSVDVCSQFIVLKADDLLPQLNDAANVVSPGWQRFFAYVEKEKIAADAGVIGKYLIHPHPDYVRLLKALAVSDRFELFDHGFTHREVRSASGAEQPEFQRLSLSGQLAHLRATQGLVAKLTGVHMEAFGAPFNAWNEDTVKALTQIPEIKTWFFGPKSGPTAGKLVLLRVMDAEYPTLHPVYDAFVKNYRPKPLFLVLQIHPRGWTVAELGQFEKMVSFLEARHACFVTSRVLRRQVMGHLDPRRVALHRSS